MAVCGEIMGKDRSLSPSKEFGVFLAGYKPLSPRHAVVLKRWREDSSKNELWQAFQSAAVEHGKSPPEPAEFIGVVLGATIPASRLNDHSEYVANQFENLKQELIRVVKDTEFPLDLWRHLQRFEETLRQLDRSVYPTDQPAGGRKDPNRSRDRKLFAQRLFRYLKNSCGEYLPTEVTKMLNIIFPLIKGTDERQVRKWLAEISPKRAV